MPDKTVLIVDADTSSLNYLAHMLQEQNYSALRAGTGKEGLIYAWRDLPDLIVFDPTLQDVPILVKYPRESAALAVRDSAKEMISIVSQTRIK